MFPNLEAELARLKMSKKDLSNITGIEYKTLLNKLNGKSPINKKDMTLIKKKAFPNMTIDYLFAEKDD